MSALRYTWGTKEDGAFKLSFAAAQRAPRSWKEELFTAAETIAAGTTKPIWVCSSGGIDSEVACRAFKERGIPFSVLTLEHAGGTNAHDIGFATAWCKAEGVTQELVVIDMQRFMTEDIDAYAEKYLSIHPFRYLQLKLMELVEEMGGFAVLCSGEQIYTTADPRRPFGRADMRIELSNGTVMPLEWCAQRKTAHEPYFHYATPELCLSYMRIPLVDFALANPDPIFRNRSNAYALKRMAYHAVWPDMVVRYKHDGFERIKPLFQAARERLVAKHGSQFVRVDLPVDEFAARLSGEML